MFVDEIDIHISAGHGGAGKVSFYTGFQVGPDGGNGGKGGDVYIKAIDDLTVLNYFTKFKAIKAEGGVGGGRNRKSGRQGQDLVLKVPAGTLVRDVDSGEEWFMDAADKQILVCRGGLGGKGNFEFKSPRLTTPKFAQPGLPGEARHVHLNLKLLAHFGLIGLPNSGKSSLLNGLTASSAKVGNYPFTTLEPNLGVLDLTKYNSGKKIIADIPGLIEGASDGKGLGVKFLKHIERVELLLHCLSLESANLLADYQIVRKELASYDVSLTQKSEVIVLTKSDLLDKDQINAKKPSLKKLRRKIIAVSIYDSDSLDQLCQLLTKV